jgi:hypothetical protein
VYPAAYPDCIAVAGTTPSDRPWKNSSWGPQVALSAPAHLVWVADFDQNGQAIVGPGSGTSFSAPHVAAAAALWLATHGRQVLLNRYGGQVPLQEVFRQLVRQTARNPGVFQTPGRPGEDVDASVGYSWEPGKYGAGILDIQALLSAALPAVQSVQPAVPAGTPLDWTDVIAGLFPDLNPAMVHSGLLGMFAGSPDGIGRLLDRYGPELAQSLMGDSAFEAFRASLIREGERAQYAIAQIDVKIHFDDPRQASQEWLTAAKALGIELGMTVDELDALRARGREVQEWLAADPVRREMFAQDPRAALAALDGKRVRTSGAPWRGGRVRWRDFDDDTMAEAGLAVGKWALAEPSRLALLRDNPAAAVEAALAGASPEARWQLIASLERGRKAARDSKDTGPAAANEEGRP